MSTPEFCFLQLAGEYPFARLVALGLELCGSYSLPSKADGTTSQQVTEQASYNLKRLTTTKKLKAFCVRLEGWPCQRKAMRALRYIADGSASPMETILDILLTLPYRYGGYGLPLPELNGRIDPEKGAGPFAGRDFYRGDLVWRGARTIAEYNSDLEHGNRRQISSDAIRQSDLALCGFTVVIVTNEQIRSMKLLDKVARQIMAGIGKEPRYKNPGFAKACRELRDILL